MPIESVEKHGAGKYICRSAGRQLVRPARFVQRRQAPTAVGAACSPGAEHERGAALSELESRHAAAMEQAGVIENGHHGEQRVEPRHPLVAAAAPRRSQCRQRDLNGGRKAGRCLHSGPDARMAITNTIAM